MILRFILAPFLVPEITNGNWGVFKDAKQKKQQQNKTKQGDAGNSHLADAG